MNMHFDKNLIFVWKTTNFDWVVYFSYEKLSRIGYWSLIQSENRGLLTFVQNYLLVIFHNMDILESKKEMHVAKLWQFVFRLFKQPVQLLQYPGVGWGRRDGRKVYLSLDYPRPFLIHQFFSNSWTEHQRFMVGNRPCTHLLAQATGLYVQVCRNIKH